MLKKTVTGMMLFLLLVSTLTLAFNIQPVKAEPVTIIVPDDYPTIQTAVNAAVLDDTIIVRAGTYVENVEVNKDHLTIKSESGAEATTIQALDSDRDVVEVVSDYVTIVGFTIKGAIGGMGHSPVGIHLNSTSHSNISQNVITENFNGIHIWSLGAPLYNVVSHNMILNNKNAGFSIHYSDGNVFERNVVSGNSFGIGLQGADNNTLAMNTIENNTRHLSSVIYGVNLADSNNNTIIGNVISDNLRGIFIRDSYDNVLAQNTIESLDNVEFYSMYSYRNHIYLNNIYNIAYSEDSSNLWNSPEEIPYTYNGKTYTNFLGNYWSDYQTRYPNAAEIDSSGIWNTPYVIDANNQDNYPLMNSWTSILPAPDFSMTAFPTSLTIAQGSSGSCTITVTSLNGFDQLVFLTASEVPSGITPSLSKQFVAPGAGGSETSTLTVSVSSTAMPGSYGLKVTGTSGAIVHDATVSLQIKRPPVLLVHGYEIRAGYDIVHDPIWKEMAEYLSGNNIGNAHLVAGHDFWKLEAKSDDYFTVYISNYTHNSLVTSSPIREYAHNLEEEIQTIKEDANVDKIYVVAHSMGGLVTRAYIENEDFIVGGAGNPYYTEYKDDISKLVMLGTPNAGVELAKVLAFIHSGTGPIFESLIEPMISFVDTDAARDVAPNSDFLGNLTLGNPADQGSDYGVKYSAIAGFYIDKRVWWWPEIMIKKAIDNKKLEWLFPWGDGAVTVDSALYGVPSARTYKDDLTHTELCTSSQSKTQVSEFLTVVKGDFFVSRYCSPGELRVYDSQGRITGLVNGLVVQEIPNSEYDQENEMVIIHPVIDSYHCEVVGTSDGNYSLGIALIKLSETIIFTANDIPIAPEEVHQYTVDWSALIQGAQGVTVQVDSNGDGIFEHTFTSDSELTQTEYIIATDKTPPETQLNVGEPKLVVNGVTYLTSATSIELIAEDDLGGSGVASTAYRIHNATYSSGWIIGVETFYLLGLRDGTYQIDYNSTDNAGNVEPTNTATVILDNTPPTTRITIGDPKYISGRTYVTADTPFVLAAIDTDSGVKSTAYRINSTSYDSGWLTYTKPFNLTLLSDGNYTIAFNSTDNAGNVEATNAVNVTLAHTLAFLSGNKHITLTGSDNVVVITGGNDVIDATQATATTVIKTGAGNDVINLGGGNNVVTETAGGNDIITTGNGDNTITITGNGNYKITTGSGNDQIQITGGGNSIINAGDGNNRVTVPGKGNNQITTGRGNDVVVAGNGNNIIKTGAGDDSITVGSGNNYVDGGTGYDVCIHGTGHNTILNCEKK